MIQRSDKGYLQSIAQELHSQSRRVRDLIGAAHWGQDGRHKEQLMINALKRHCPAAISVATGFVISPTDQSCSTEQDLLAVDCLREAPIFGENGLSIAFPRDVVASISIKTSFNSSTFKNAVEGLWTVRKVAASAGIDPGSIWCAAYFFEECSSSDEALPMRWFEEVMSTLPYDLSFKGAVKRYSPVDFWATLSERAYVVDNHNDNRLTVRGFRCFDQLATAVLVAHFIDHVAVRRGAQRSDFSDFADSPSLEVIPEKSITV